MNREELRALLVRLDIRDDAYSLEGSHGWDQHVLGHQGHEWLVYYSERGGEHDIARFKTENEACQEMLRRLLSDSSTRRA